MDWKKLLACIAGLVDQELLLRNHTQGRMHLSDGERKTLAAIRKQLGKQALAEVVTIVKPDIILAWHRKLIAQKFDGSAPRQTPGRPRVDKELEALVVRMARKNRSWGYDHITGALRHLDYTISDQTVGNILKRHGTPPVPERKKTTTWKAFIRMHTDVLVATDFSTTKVWPACGLVTY
jgi:putative transposase